MRELSQDQTIITCSSGTRENVAISVIRLSGSFALKDLTSYFSLQPEAIQPRYAHLTEIRSGEVVLDEVIFLYYPAPHSFTGEHVIELMVHGNQLNVERILSLFVDTGFAELAQPGEFSYRAFRNRKLTLSQVEGLDLFLNASNPLVLNEGFSTLHGELHRHYLELREAFLKLRSAVELSFDFLDDVGEESADELFQTAANEFNQKLSLLFNRTQISAECLMTPVIVLAGPPNAGKSTLFNYLLSHDRSIVSTIPGTTRDYVSEQIRVEGIPFQLVDTAGLRKTSDQIEDEGIRRSYQQLDNAFFRVLLYLNPEEVAHLNLDDYDLIFRTHADTDYSCNSLSETTHAVSLTQSGPIGPEFVRTTIFSELVKRYRQIESLHPILQTRQVKLLSYLYSAWSQLYNALGQLEMPIISSELNILAPYLEDLIGVTSPDDVLDNLFSNFCIGK